MSRIEYLLTAVCLGLTSVAAQAAPFAAESGASGTWLLAATGTALTALLVRAALLRQRSAAQAKAQSRVQTKARF